ncbi:hypothetical protein P3X46_024771 [Hevea brasiliensis]|uniref:Leucine-rich repeat-containing N-terminal plant-type domain-containing protein n=2 Tax=Hevea brasiliensis TaxID=3981 RepID=A0ABQ9L6T3_HEVBR|nr:hypothetical protein P3X46_024771 [Hevea brasiliensis]
MGRVSVLGFVLAILSILTSDFGCNGDGLSRTCSQSDLQALIDFKNGLRDSGNRLSSWQGSNCCQWEGISCNNRTGAVISIDLHNPYPVSSAYSLSTSRPEFWNLSGEIRPSVLKIKSLQYLDSSLNTFNQIPIPEFLGSLQSLQYLNLSKAGFSGAVPPALGNLSSLQFLDVSSEFSDLSVNSFDWVPGLVSIKYLAMTGVDLSMVGSTWVEVLNMLPHLTGLYLSNCGLSGSIASLNPVNFTSLAVLDLSFNNFNSLFPNWLENVSSLAYFDLSSSGLYGSIPLGLSELPNLQYLSLAMNNNLSASCSRLFQGSWKKIEVLDFAMNKLHGQLPASIGNMSTLTNFDLFVNNVEGGIPSFIGKLCNLQTFDLSGNNLIGSLPEVLEETNCLPNSPLPGLMYSRLTSNHLVGNLPDLLGQLENLAELSLDNNLLQGQIPASLGNLKNLANLGLAGNQLNGTLPDSLGQLSQLSTLDVSLNNLAGYISEAHLSRLSNLKFLFLASNSLVFNVSSNWLPPFQAQNLDLGSCHLGPSFPGWLRNQKKVVALDISNASISDAIPNWFWDITSTLSLLNASFNQLSGQLRNPFSVAPFADVDFSSNLLGGPIPLPDVEIELLDLSKNQFSGPIPQNISESMPNLIFLSLSDNQLTGNIPVSIGDMLSLQVIDLSRNNLMGSIPASIGNCSFLKALDLSLNNLSGMIPVTLGQLNQLQSLHLSNNKLSGNLPSSFQKLSSLETLDLANNELSGKIPWGGGGFSRLRILSLRSNAISGEIPPTLSNLSSLQVLDLAVNNLTGSMPVNFGDFKAMSREQYINQYLLYGKYRGLYYQESLVVNIKGGPKKYTKTLSLVTSIDLSGNDLRGEFPDKIAKLVGLVSLNLSKNQIIGHIPQGISNLRQLSSLDLSSNELSGAIPSSMSSLSFLSALNLSKNNFSGMIPYTGQMTTFPASSFAENPGLCGAPLILKCLGDDSDRGGTVIEETSSDGFIDKWFYLSVGLGFAAGILVPTLILAIRKPWSDAYFGFVDKIVDSSMRAKRRTATNRRK